MNVKEIKVKTCMARSMLADYVINPYIGCSHGCIYCYADFMKKFQNIPDKWGEFVFAKMNCPELLEKELLKNKPGQIMMSSVCDCYMPEESKYGLTRRVLEAISRSGKKSDYPIEILTKSSLVKRDFGLLKELDVELGMSINQLDEKTAKIIEPLASSPAERLKTLKEAKEKGIKTYGFVSPVLPGLCNLGEVFQVLKESGVGHAWVELFNMRGAAIWKMLPVYKNAFPDKLKEFEWARDNREAWHAKIREEAEEAGKKYDLEIKAVIVHGK